MVTAARSRREGRRGRLARKEPNGGAKPDRVAEIDAGYSQSDEVVAPQLATDRRVDLGKVANATLVLQPGPDGPDMLEHERRLRSDDLAVASGYADGLMIKTNDTLLGRGGQVCVLRAAALLTRAKSGT